MLSTSMSICSSVKRPCLVCKGEVLVRTILTLRHHNKERSVVLSLCQVGINPGNPVGKVEVGGGGLQTSCYFSFVFSAIQKSTFGVAKGETGSGQVSCHNARGRVRAGSLGHGVCVIGYPITRIWLFQCGKTHFCHSKTYLQWIHVLHWKLC